MIKFLYSKKIYGGVFMKKADLLEEVIYELSLIQKQKNDKRGFYTDIIRLIKTKVPHYNSITIYLTTENSFYFFKHEGNMEDLLEDMIPFGEGFISLVAAKGEIACEFKPVGQTVYIPFYDGHNLLGEVIINTNQFIDTEELKLLNYIQKILGSNH